MPDTPTRDTALKTSDMSETAGDAGGFDAIAFDPAHVASSIDLDQAVLTALHEAAVGDSRPACIRAIDAAVQSGISPAALADHYVPYLARQMGALWHCNDMGFAMVTVGASRLQSMLRHLGTDWKGDQAANPDAAAIMLIVPHGVDHTLGAMVLGGQLRRSGYSVRLMLGARVEDVALRLKRGSFQAVFISAAAGDRLETLRRMVDGVKAVFQSPPPIVIGGSLLEVATKQSVTSKTGADHATNNPSEALKLCGLTKTHLSRQLKMDEV